ncbi:MAG TPA: three component ABC system middle component [Armatimonadota bacterium]|jgi:hypothetical protein
MKPWNKRAPEVAYLLNPAFCGEVLRRTLGEHLTIANQPMAYPLIFLILPLVLHKGTRQLIDGRTQQLHTWLQSHPEVKVDFAERTRRLAPVSRESLLFLQQVGAVTIDEDARIVLTPFLPRTLRQQRTGEIAECYKKALVVGRWFARAGLPETVFTILGVTP